MAAIKALEQIEERPELLIKLRERSIRLHNSICQSQLTKYFTLGSDKISPLKHLYLKEKFLSHAEEQNTLKNIVDYVSNCLRNFFF